MRSLKSTTAALLAVSLAMPAPAMAQGQGNAKGLAKQLARDLGVEVCGADAILPCVTDARALRIYNPDLAASLEICTGEALPCATEDGFVDVAPDSDLALQALAGDEETETAGAEPEGAMDEGTAGESADMVAVEDAEGGEPEAVSTIDEDTTAETEVPPAEKETAEAGDASAEEEEITPDMAEAVEDSEPVDDAANAETVVEADEQSAAEAEAETVAEADMPGAEEVPADSAPIDEETIIEDVAPSAAAAATSDEETAAEAEVETEEVTEETARSSSEDFQTAVTGDAKQKTKAKDSDGDGLSNFEKALLLGLGAVAVGSILDSGEEVVSNSGDRVVLQDTSGNLRVLKNDDALLRQPGSQVQTETFNDGSTRTTVTRDDGTRIVTIRDANGRVLRRVREFEDGSRVVLFDDTEVAEPVDITTLPDVEERRIDVDTTDEDALRIALAEAQARDVGRRFSLNQVRQIREVRELAPELDLDAITFATGSAAIDPSQAEELAALGRAMSRIIDERPGEVFLIEGHTDAVGSATYNLALSDRRAETVALALTEYFGVPPENMVTQGYGESALRIDTQEAERLNRRATIRRITPLLRQVALND